MIKDDNDNYDCDLMMVEIHHHLPHDDNDNSNDDYHNNKIIIIYHCLPRTIMIRITIKNNNNISSPVMTMTIPLKMIIKIIIYHLPLDDGPGKKKA